MTNKQLIKVLSELDGNKEVLVSDDLNGIFDMCISCVGDDDDDSTKIQILVRQESSY